MQNKYIALIVSYVVCELCNCAIVSIQVYMSLKDQVLILIWHKELVKRGVHVVTDWGKTYALYE